MTPPDPSTQQDLPSLDVAWLQELRSDCPTVQGDIVSELVAIFLQDAPRRLAALRTATANGICAQAQAAAHAIKGSSATIRAVKMARLAEHIEDLAARGDLGEVAVRIDPLEQEFQIVAALLRAIKQ